MNARTMNEAALMRAELVASVQAPPPTARPRLNEYAARWAEARAATIKPSTRARYALALRAIVADPIGDFWIDTIDRADVSAWRDRQSGAPATVNGRLRVLRALLADAVADGVIPRSPALGVRPVREPARTEETSNRLTAGEASAVLRWLEEHASAWHPQILAALITGARHGELSALRWSDIDHAAGEIRIARAQWHGSVDSTKTGTVRVVPMPEALSAALKAHRARMLSAQHPGLSSGLVFPSRAGTPQFASAPREVLQRAVRAVGIDRRITLHGLRRSLNNLARQVAAAEVVRSITGHVTEQMTEHYSWIERDEKRRAVDGVLAMLTVTPTVTSGDGSGTAGEE
ncbi:MAG: tyrosine-type recombinase/integrase [Sandaracinaceae bacterium]